MLDATYLWVLGAWAFWGTYPVPFKHPSIAQANIDPFVLQFMKSGCVFITSWIVLLWKPFYFTYYGFIGAALWVPAGLTFITAVKLTGVAFATPVANGFQVLVNFCWGAFYFKEEVKNPYLSVLAMLIMVVGMAGISYAVNYEKMQKKATPYVIQDGADQYVVEDGKDGADETTPFVNPKKITGSGDQEAQQIVPTNKPNETRNFVLGILACFACGIFGGSQSVPLQSAPEEAHGALYIISFGIGSVGVIAVYTAIYVVIRLALGKGLPIAKLNVSLLPGSVAGCLWSAGNVCNIYAVVAFGQTIGAPLVLCNMLVAGLWGVFYYKEAPRLSMKGLFLGSCATLLGGVILLSHFG